MSESINYEPNMPISKPEEKPPWNPSKFVWIAIFFTFGAAGIIAGINWKRLGKPDKMMPTIIFSIAGLLVLIGFAIYLPFSNELVRILGEAINVGIGFWLSTNQKADYLAWVEAQDEEKPKEAGCMTPIIVGIGVTLIILALIIGLAYLKPNPTMSNFDRGVEYLQNGEYELAIEANTNAIELAPDFAEAYRNRGFALVELGEYERAIIDLNQALELNPELDGAYAARGQAYALSEQYELAIPDLAKATRLEPNQPVYYYWLGIAYLQVDKNQSAVAVFQRVLELNPELALKQKIENILEDMGA